MFLRRIFGIEVSRSFDVSEDGIEGTLTNRNPDDHNWLQKVQEQVHSDNNASEVDILGHFGTIWDNFGQFGILYEKFGAFRLFSQCFPTLACDQCRGSACSNASPMIDHEEDPLQEGTP